VVRRRSKIQCFFATSFEQQQKFSVSSYHYFVSYYHSSSRVFSMALREILSNFFIVACNLNAGLKAAEYLSALSDADEKNYDVFWSFASGCSSTLLCVMTRLGHCAGSEKLLGIIRELVEMRISLEHEEEDSAGYIADFLRQSTCSSRKTGK